MLVKPKAWLSHDNGGYIFNKSKQPHNIFSEALNYVRQARLCA